MKFGEIKERAFEHFEQLQEKARAFWMGLNQREKVILGSLLGLFSLLITIFIFKFTLGAFIYRQAQVESAMQNATKIQRIAYELVDQKRHLLKFERLRKTRGENFNLRQFIEQQANRYGVSIESIAPSRATSAAEKEEERMEVILSQKTSLDSALRFLEAVEGAIGVRLIDLKIKSFANSQLEITAMVGNTKDL